MRVIFSRISAFALATVAGILLAGPFSADASAQSKTKQKLGEPKHKPSGAFQVPKEVTLTTKVEPADAKPGDTVTYTVTAKVNAPFHIYAFTKKQPDEGPRGTQFDFYDPAGLELGKEWEASAPPEEKLDSAFENMKVQYHEDEVSWSRNLKVPADGKTGQKILKNQIYFMICNANTCKGPVYVNLPDVKLTVKENKCSSISPIDPTMLAMMLVATTPAVATAPSAPAPAPAGDFGRVTEQGLGAFLLYSALGGLFAVLMPCVWPMIPITVNFFVKQGESKNGSPTKLAIVYCLAIVGIFTGIGLAVTAALGASGANQLGANKWVNLFFGIAFIGLGLSLLGLFEIRLPSALLNASSQAEGKGGLLGVMFMATTLTITSFTCTAPVVGTLLVASTKGQFFYPVLGLLTFSSVMALPFFVLALVPGLMKKMPKSGDWMNAVKVVGGLVEIALAFKFLNTAEIGFGASSTEAYIDSQFVLTVWVVTALACGIYLLGLFRTDHDYEAIQVGPLRMVTALGFLSVGLFLAPALFGNPPQSKFYEAIVGILPPDIEKLDARQQIVREVVSQLRTSQNTGPIRGSDGLPAQVASEPEIHGPVAAVSKDPKIALREEKRFHGVAWGMSYEAAREEAKAKNKPILIDFTGVFCTNCRTVEKKIMPKPDVVAELRKFVTVALFVDSVDIKALSVEDREDLALENGKIQAELANTNALPVYVAMSPDGKVLGQTEFDPSNDNFLRDFLKKMQEKLEAGKGVAATGGL